MYCNKIGLCAQNISAILSLIMNTIGRAYVIIQRVREYEKLNTYNFYIYVVIQ